MPEYIDPAKKSDPKTFVFWRGKHGVSHSQSRQQQLPYYAPTVYICLTNSSAVQRIMKSLEGDLRRVMQPNTAENLRVGAPTHWVFLGH